MVTFKTASTAMGERTSEFPETILEDKEVLTQLMSESLSESSTGMVMVLRISMDL